MSFAKFTAAAVVALGMATAPVLAEVANPASKLSVANAASVRSGAALTNENQARGGSIILALVAAGLVIAGIIIAADGDDEPASP